VLIHLEKQIVRRVKAWYRIHRRVLPWRETRDPYRIWVSEIMLQQTQVATVIPYYHRFLDRFPDPRALATAPEDEVLKIWAGLGYYRRARQLHAAAKQIVALHGGKFPRHLEAVLALPGVGRYTAQAILSFAHDERLGIVEANTQRLYARLLYLTDPIPLSASQKRLWEFAERIVPPVGCGEFNQAMMEIGSQICTPRNPNCAQCPLLPCCPTGERGHSDRIPAPKEKKVITNLTEAAILVSNTSAQWLVRRCGVNERWAGLWDFPRIDISDFHNASERNTEIQSRLWDEFGVRCEIGSPIIELQHAVTRYRITLQCFIGNLTSECLGERRAEALTREVRWLRMEQLQDLAWNASGLRVLKWLQEASLPNAKNLPKLVHTLSGTKALKSSEYRS
jgi:A/G-specific adenine glycosylase